MEALVMLLLLSILSPNVLVVLCARYDVPQPWRISIGPATRASTIDGTLMEYALISNGSRDIVSENGTYALAVLGTMKESYRHHGFSLFYFEPHMYAVVMQKSVSQSPRAVAVWKADMETAFTEDVWKGDLNATFPDVDFNVVQLDETGNLVLYNNGRLVWQSFDHPVDVLLPGQHLTPGQHLESGMRRYPWDSDWKTRVFGEVINNSFILYSTYYPGQSVISSSSLQYGVWSLGASEEDALRCRGNEVVLRFTGSELKLLYEARSESEVNSSCQVPDVPLLSSRGLENMSPFVRLDVDGKLVLYRYDSASGSWLAAVKLTDTLAPCRLPYACEFHDCWLPAFEFYDPGDFCDFNICASDHDIRTGVVKYGALYFRLDGVSHFAVNFMAPTQQNVSIQECTTYVDFIVYDNSLRNCYSIISPRTIFYRDNTTLNMTVLIKEIGYHEGYKMVLLFWFVGFALTALPFMIVYILVVKIKYQVRYKVRRKLRAGVTLLMNYFNKKVREIEALLSTMQDRLPRRYTYMELEDATEGFTTQLGAGGFGWVYEGVTSDGRHVAVKKLYASDKQMKQFVTEVVGIGGVSHINIIKLYGFCIDGTSRRLLVYEFMPNGSLDRWIFGSDEEKTLSWQQRLDIALGTARGLRYLHEECSEPILHLDVKPQNILLDANFVPKVADFGVAKLLDNRDMTHATTTSRGTFGYMAPEWIMQNVASTKCDVYSYGLVLLEIIGGRKKADLSRGNDGSIWYFPAWVVQRVKEKDVIRTWDEKVKSFAAENEEQAMMMVHLALWCIQRIPSLRPSFSEIVEVLEGKRVIGEPPMCFHFNFQNEELPESSSEIVPV